MGEKQNKFQDTSQPTKLPNLYSGMRIEVLTLSNHLIFVAVATILENNQLELRDESGQNTPWVEYNTKVKLRGFQRDGVPFFLYGSVCGSAEKFWRIDRFETLQVQNLRHYYRQTLSIQGTVMCVDSIFGVQSGEKVPSGPVDCSVMDISGGGIRIRCKKNAQFQVGNWLFFSADNPLADEQRMNYTCRVRRVLEEKDYYEYGCEFDGLTEAERETLLRIVMLVQQRELRSRRRTDNY